MLKSLAFTVLEDGSLEVQYQEEGGPVYSFDPSQLPAKLDTLLPDVLKEALVRADNAEAEVAALKSPPVE